MIFLGMAGQIAHFISHDRKSHPCSRPLGLLQWRHSAPQIGLFGDMTDGIDYPGGIIHRHLPMTSACGTLLFTRHAGGFMQYGNHLLTSLHHLIIVHQNR